LKPPAIPLAILNFFASQPDFAAVAGDISEEFHQRVQKSGANAAKRWYWREVFRNALALTWRELLRTPVRTTLVALSCFFAVNIVTHIVTNVLWRHGLMYGPSPWSMLTIDLMALLVMGLVGGRLLPGREWALALTFTACSITYTAGFIFLVWGLRGYLLALSSLHSALHLSALQLAAIVLWSLAGQGAFWLGCLWIRVHSRSFAATSAAPGTPQSSAPRNPPDLL
jgi:hypothetical protein